MARLPPPIAGPVVDAAAPADRRVGDLVAAEGGALDDHMTVGAVDVQAAPVGLLGRVERAVVREDHVFDRDRPGIAAHAVHVQAAAPAVHVGVIRHDRIPQREGARSIT